MTLGYNNNLSAISTTDSVKSALISNINPFDKQLAKKAAEDSIDLIKTHSKEMQGITEKVTTREGNEIEVVSNKNYYTPDMHAYNNILNAYNINAQFYFGNKNSIEYSKDGKQVYINMTQDVSLTTMTHLIDTIKTKDKAKYIAIMSSFTEYLGENASYETLKGQYKHIKNETKRKEAMLADWLTRSLVVNKKNIAKDKRFRNAIYQGLNDRVT